MVTGVPAGRTGAWAGRSIRALALASAARAPLSWTVPGITVSPSHSPRKNSRRSPPAGSASASSARLFTPTVTPAKTSYGQPNPVTQSVYIPPANQKVKPNPPATAVTVVTAADVIAFNKAFWGAKTS